MAHIDRKATEAGWHPGRWPREEDTQRRTRVVRFSFEGPVDWLVATLGNSLADGVHHIGPGRTITVETLAGSMGGGALWHVKEDE